MPFYHCVGGRWYSSEDMAYPSKTMDDYKASCRWAYGSLRGVKFATSARYVGNVLVGDGDWRYPKLTARDMCRDDGVGTAY